MAAAAGELPFRTGLVGRAAEIGKLRHALDGAAAGRGRVVFLAGEAGIGKSRLLEELATYAAAKGFHTMEGTCFPESLTPYAAFLEAFQKGELDYLFIEEPLRLESLFAIDKAGLVLAKAERSESPLDPDIFTSMLRVVEEFLRDAVRMAGGDGKKGGLSVLGLANYRIVLEQGPHVAVVAVLRGRESEFLLEDMKDVVARVEDKFGGVLATWAGTLDDLEGMDDFLKPVLASKKYDGVDYARGDALLRRNRLFENVSLGLVREAARAPILLMLDDLQWADPSTISLIHYIARGIRDAPVLLVGAYRAEELAMGLHGKKHPLEEAMQLMSREGLHDEVRLVRLNDAQTTELVEALLGNVELAEEYEREVFRHSGGNPFFLIELARLVVQEGLLVREGDTWRFSKGFQEVEIPTGVYNVVLRRVQRVTPEERDVLDLAAVLGEEFTADVLASCLNKERIALLKLLRDLEVTHQLVRSSQARYKFDHAQLREVLLREMPDGIRMEYHRIGGEALERVHGTAIATNRRALAEVAYHYYEARDAPKGVAYNLLAASAAKQAYANEESIRFYAQALELMGEVAAPGERAEALETRGDVRDLAAHYDDAIADYRQAIGLRAGDEEGAARLLRKVGSIYQRRGEYAEAEAELQKAVALHGEHLDAELGRAELALGQTVSRRGDHVAAMEHYRRAHDIITTAPDRDDFALAEAQYSAGMVHYWIAMREPPREAEELAAARTDFLACLETRKRIGDELGMRPALNMLANTYGSALDQERAIPYYEESVRIGERLGDLWGITKPLINLGRMYYERGDRDRALAMYLRALSILVKIGDQHGLAVVYWFAADIYLGSGEIDKATNYYTRSLEIAEQSGNKVARAGALQGLGMSLVHRGQLGEAIERFTNAIDAFEAVAEWLYACLAAADLVRVHVALDEFDAAQRVCARARTLAARGEAARFEGLCHAMEASIARGRGKIAEAERGLAAARAVLGEHPADTDVAGVEYEEGLLLRAQDRAAEATGHLERSVAAARRAGLFGLAALAEHARGLG